ncbi:MAG: HipA N-terminal domain-containing protein [Candidatus Azotimanducaceae bacterium WSBS_2022_MAG_OTU7]
MEHPDRPTLGLFFKDEFGALRTEFKPVQKQVMPVFSNLLPEGQLRKYLAEQAELMPSANSFCYGRWVSTCPVR